MTFESLSYGLHHLEVSMESVVLVFGWVLVVIGALAGVIGLLTGATGTVGALSRVV